MRILIIVLALVMSAAAKDEFKNPTARSAQLRYEQALKRIQREYANSLKRAMQSAMRSGDLEEANKIQSIVEELAKNTAQYKTYTVEFKDKTASWRKTKIRVRKGEAISISATALAKGDPTAPTNTRFGTTPGTRGALFMRLGDDLYEIGTGKRVTATQDGFLEFAFNLKWLKRKRVMPVVVTVKLVR